MALLITFIELLPYIALVLVVAGIAVFYVLYEKNKKQKPADDEYLASVIKAIGDVSNIISIHHVQRRTQIELLAPEKVDVNQLKALQISAFMTGKKITLLLNENREHTLFQLIKKRKEEQ